MICELMRLTKEVEVKSVEVKGEMRSVLNNRVAISEGGSNTTFIDITAWGSLAELMGQYLKKGSEFYGEGMLKNKSRKIGEQEVQLTYIGLERIKFTYGNKSKETTQVQEPPHTEEQGVYE